jgi:RNA polymerase sigma-70 factor (ECF subfamily)
MDELTAVKTSRNGDRNAFGVLIERYYKSIYRYAYQCVGNHQDADDICQETFLRALNNIRALKDDKRFKGWIFQIATNLSRKRVKNMSFEKNIVTATDSDFLPRRSENKCTQPFKNVIGREKVAVIQDELWKMPEHIRTATILVLIEGFSQKETAEVLNRSQSSISRDIEIGKDRLRQRLQKLI